MSFKFCSISDTHHGLSTDGAENPKTGLNTRAEDSFYAFDQTIDYMIANKIKLLIHSGDIMNVKVLPQAVLDAFYQRVKKLTDNNIFFYALQGNHDANLNTNKRNGIDVANTLGVKNTYFTRGNDYLDLGYTQIVSLSYWNTAESTEKFLDEVAKNQVDWERPVILVGHLEVDYPGSIGAFSESIYITPLELLTKHPWNCIQLGHVHKSIILNESPKVFYTGSLVRCTFTEEDFKKGFWVNTVDNKKFTMEQIPVDCLKMLTIRGTSEEIHEQLKSKKPKDFNNVIVRIIADTTALPLDEKFIKDKMAETFKYKIQKQSQKIQHKKIEATNLLGLNEYTKKYFKGHKREGELIALVKEFQGLDEAKNIL